MLTGDYSEDVMLQLREQNGIVEVLCIECGIQWIPYDISHNDFCTCKPCQRIIVERERPEFEALIRELQQGYAVDGEPEPENAP